ncbi:hypothetical protein [Nitrosovibrio sp. Nv6]|uniref:hypothetical protein n=1 Tax=Nitrosovibrio sp. Nv6 TaxID=1855340 RepID=UPI0008C70AB3|nr:hypothetical protein [Nitrosovibrio sp. Nv6]SEP44035.1 hypothetical protein SAMN05216316_3163 [Nitrosovibrio sp. Nv6]
MEDNELHWRQYQLNIDTYRDYLGLVMKMNGFYYAVTGAVVSYYFAHQSEPVMQLSLVLPLVMSVALAIFFLLCAFSARVMRNDTFSLRDKLKLDAAAEIGVLMLLLVISAGLMLVIASGLGWLLWFR